LGVGKEMIMNDRDIAARAADMRTRARDYALIEIPSYAAWAKKQLDQGESEALIAHLDATSMWLLPEEVAGVAESEFEELLSELKGQVGEQ